MKREPKICCMCATYNRPRVLGQAIAMFEAQTYPHKELIILADDGLPYPITEGPNWRIISKADERQTVGQKRNEIARMTDATILQTWDDDDCYLPWALAASAAPYASPNVHHTTPRQAMEWLGPGKVQRTWTYSVRLRTDYCYGGQWSWRRESFCEMGGYSKCGQGDDTEFEHRFKQRFGRGADTISEQYPLPFYIYSRDQSPYWHASDLGRGRDGLWTLRDMPREDPATMKIELPPWYYTIEIPNDIKPRVWQ